MDLAPGTWRLAGPVLGAGAIVLVVSRLIGISLLMVGLGILWFHRDPNRRIPEDGVTSPADGTVTVIREEHQREGPDRVRVGVFMNVTDVHVNRAPIGGEVARIEHVPGGHWPAFTKDAARNERLHVDIDGTRVTLIAGTLARRIHPHVTSGEDLAKGERIGHVSFGSRVDVLLPERFGMQDLRAEKGETVRAGESILASDPGQ